MVTKRTTHAQHNKGATASKRRVNSRAASRNSAAYTQSRVRARSKHAYSAKPPTPSQRDALLTRRNFLYGALGLGGAAAVGFGVPAIMDAVSSDEDTGITTLSVPEDAVTTQSDFDLVDDCTTRMSLIGDFELTYGTLVWVNDDNIAACLMPTEGASPLTQVGLLSLSSGTCTTILEEAIGVDQGFEIYDVRANSTGVIWLEADIIDNTWCVYTATYSDSVLGSPTLVATGNDDYDTPSLAIAGSRGFWQVLPKSGGAKSSEESVLMGVTLGGNDIETVYTSAKRMCTFPYALEDSLVITPRADSTSVYYQLTHLDASNGSALDTMTLPYAMYPLEAGYGETGFMFSFDGTYTYGDGIANLGTYVPMTAATTDTYSDVPWFQFSRDPSAPPMWCGKYLMVKSTSAVCGIDFDAGEYFVFDVESGSDSYGEYLASTGIRDTVVTYANVDNVSLSNETTYCCRVRVWTPIS